MAASFNPRGIHLEDFRMSVQAGSLEEITAVYHVTEPTATDELFEPWMSLLRPGVPQIGDRFDPTNSSATEVDFDELRCEDQEITTAGKQPNGEYLVAIKCTFRRQPLEPRIISGGAGLQQVATQKLKDGTQVLVEYNGRTQGGELQVTVPTTGFEIEVVEITGTPVALQESRIGKVNSGDFNDLGAAPRTWKIVDISYRPAMTLWPPGLPPQRWIFTYRFELNEETHDPSAVYVDPETGEIPPDLVIDEGIKTFEYDDSLDFASIFNIRSF